jgi:GH15 family glucan-1,4-alpha-glucosidase
MSSLLGAVGDGAQDGDASVARLRALPAQRPAVAGAPSFPAIADYAVLSDCENTCLVAPSGAVEWLCLPRPHDPSVFGTLLDRSAGSFRLGPADMQVPASRRYLPGTKVLETTWQTRTGWLVVTDFLAVGPWHRTHERSVLHRRTPGDYDADHVLVRVATCVHGSVEVALDCEPAFDYGRTDAAWEYSGDGYDQAATTTPGDVTLRLVGDLRLGHDGRAVRARHRMQAGESRYAALGWGSRPLPADLQQAQEALAHTERFWRGWLDDATFPDHPWREPLQRSALTLKALTYTPTGALLAASTTSLPEQLGGERNWDYRYTWIRDAAFTLWALHGLGLDAEADDFLAFLSDTLDAPGDEAPCLQVLYGVDGARDVTESQLDHLSGYAGSRPVRIGNAAHGQQQHDIFGAIVDCVYQHTRNRDALSERSWRLVVIAVEEALAAWREPDRGIWEVRGEPRHFTHSKVMCWVAADRGARLAVLRGDAERATAWRAAADEIHADVLAHAVDDRGRFTQSYGSGTLDAALLMLPLMRFLPPEDPRLRATVLGIADELTENGLVLRYRTESTDDGLHGEEGSFLACSFWLVSALSEIGEHERARALCERLLAAASPLGLYAEELSPATGRHLGNFPQALTHLALINAVLHLVAAEDTSGDDVYAATLPHIPVQLGGPTW